MFRVYISLFIVFLFYVLTPGVFLSLPKGGSLKTKALVHGVVFAIVFHLTYKMAWKFLYGGKNESFFGDDIDEPLSNPNWAMQAQ
jgi:hypothetical protein